MKLYGLLVVQNEEDIIEYTLKFLRDLNIYEKIFFYDLGSEDDTFMRAQKFRDILFNPQVLTEAYSNKLRHDLLLKHHTFYERGDWIAIIDADEFYVDNPVDFINLAEKENATYISTYQIDFMFTDSDLINFEHEDLNLPIYERRKYYLIDHSEERFYKFLPDEGLFNQKKPCSRRLLNRHYRYRTPSQMNMRIKTRLENKRKAENIPGREPWAHVFSPNFKDYIISDKILHKYTVGEFKFGIPEGVEWKDYYSKNPSFSLIPQKATALMQYKLNFEYANKKNEGTRKGKNKTPGLTPSNRGIITFNDVFSEKLVAEAFCHFQKYNWKEAIRCLYVLIRYYMVISSKHIKFNSKFALISIKYTAWNIYNNVKRLALLRSWGTISAKPNPIAVFDFNGVGITTLSWTSRTTQTVEVHINSPDGRLLCRANGSGSYTTGRWVEDDMVFFLQDVTGGLPLTSAHTIAKARVKLKIGKSITI